MHHNAHHTMHLMDEVLDHYSIGNVLTVRKPTEGTTNRVWMLNTAERKLVLRGGSLYRKDEEIRMEHSFLMLLHKHRYPYRLPIPISTTGQETFVKIHGEYFWLYDFIEGKTSRLGRHQFVACVARAMSQAHSIAARHHYVHQGHVWNPFEVDWLVHELERSLQNTALNGVEAYELYKVHARKAISFAKKISCPALYKNLPRMIIHTDWNENNILVSGNDICGILDFGNCRDGTEIEDIALFINHYCWDGKEIDQALMQLFLDSYREHRSISIAEAELIPAIALSDTIDELWWQYDLLKHGKSTQVTAELIESIAHKLDHWAGCNSF